VPPSGLDYATGNYVAYPVYHELASGSLLVATEHRNVVTEVVLHEGANDLLNHKPAKALLAVSRGDVVYAIGTDCDLLNDAVTWLGGNEPDLGKHYSVTYTYAPTYRVFRMLGVDRRYPGAVELPKRFHLKLVDTRMRITA
jgi:hypothetical protein